MNVGSQRPGVGRQISGLVTSEQMRARAIQIVVVQQTENVWHASAQAQLRLYLFLERNHGIQACNCMTEVVTHSRAHNKFDQQVRPACHHGSKPAG